MCRWASPLGGLDLIALQEYDFHDAFTADFRGTGSEETFFGEWQAALRIVFGSHVHAMHPRGLG